MRNAGAVIDDVVDTFFSELSKLNPDAASKIKIIDPAYARFKPLQYLCAVKRPSGLIHACFTSFRAQSRGRRKPGLQSLADIEKPLQQLALDGQEILPSKLSAVILR